MYLPIRLPGSTAMVVRVPHHPHRLQVHSWDLRVLLRLHQHGARFSGLRVVLWVPAVSKRVDCTAAAEEGNHSAVAFGALAWEHIVLLRCPKGGSGLAAFSLPLYGQSVIVKERRGLHTCDGPS